MIRLEQTPTPGRPLVNVPSGSKKHVPEQVANLIARELPELDAQTTFENLVAREELGSTGFGNDIAIPHCRLSGCQSPISAVLHLDVPVDLDALDGASVGLLFVLLVPETATEEHLGLFRQIAATLDCADVRDRLCSAPTAETLYQTVVGVQNGQ